MKTSRFDSPAGERKISNHSWGIAVKPQRLRQHGVILEEGLAKVDT